MSDSHACNLELSEKKVTRRSFLKRTAALSAGAAAFPMIVPSSALGLGDSTAPSNRLVMGCIGVGSQGTGNMRGFLRKEQLQVVAVSDVDRSRRAAAQKIVDQSYDDKACAGYHDFRELLARDDLDVISIAVPDHWHALVAIAAADRKRDIYAEKPLALTIPEGRAMVEAVKRNNIVWQTGSWQRSRRPFLQACEIVRNGLIGEVHTVRVGLPTGNPCAPQPKMPIPEGFDYDFWLGPAPAEPYTEQRCHWNFRWILDYSGGQLTDWGAHHCDIANWGMDTEGTGPVEIEGTGVFPRDGLWDAATDYYLSCRYPKGVSSVSPKGFKMLVSNAFPMGARFEGTNGWVHVSRGGYSTSSADLKEAKIEKPLYRSNDHAQNFIDCVHNRKDTVTPISAAHHAIAIAHLGNISMRLGRKVRWNPEKEEFINDPVADRMLSRTMRGSWHM